MELGIEDWEEKAVGIRGWILGGKKNLWIGGDEEFKDWVFEFFSSYRVKAKLYVLIKTKCNLTFIKCNEVHMG